MYIHEHAPIGFGEGVISKGLGGIGCASGGEDHVVLHTNWH